MQYNCMSQKDYVILCIGNKRVNLNKLKELRMLCWTIAAPNLSVGMTMERFWRLDGDESTDYVAPTTEQLSQWDSEFRKLGKAF
jgi:hypothetical protein